MNFGLSPNQAKTYLTLIRLNKEATPTEIWKISDIPREEVYRKLKELFELNLVEKILGPPRLFKAVPLRTVLKELINKKAEELSQLAKDSEELLRLNHKIESENILEQPYKTIIVPKKRATIEKAKKEMLNLKKSLDCVLSFEKAMGWFSAHHEIFKDMMRRNVKIRWILEKRKNSDFLKQVKKIPNSQLFEVKEVSSTLGACLGIYDRKVVLIDTSASSDFIQTPMMWSNNPSLIVLAQNYFDIFWNNNNIS